ncbi:Wzz/FepE/Etk N-terminal domain-containing protein [Candidatus Kapabacteria bacterium]|nr:Wzz/FepE/Etk N-terminal domain-containing protein [Candidatus Kapabacteria bacterium]
MSEDQNELSPAVYYVGIILRNKWLIATITFIVTVASIIYSLYFVEVQFKSTVNLVPPRSTGSAFENMISNVGSSLKKLGLNSLTGGGDGQSYEYMVILESRTVQDSIIKKYNLKHIYELDEDTTMLNTRKMFALNHKVEFLETGNYLISVWDKDKIRASKMANDFASIADGLSTKLDMEEADYNLFYLEKRLSYIDSAYKKIADSLKIFASKYKVFSFEDQAKSYSNAISELKQQEMLAELSYDYTKDVYGSNDFETLKREKLLSSLREQLKNVMVKPGMAGNMTINNAGQIAVEYANLYADFEAFTTIRAFLLPMIEKARLDVNKNTKNLFVIDKAIPADKKDRPKRSLLVIGSFLGSFVLTIFFILIINAYKRFIANVKLHLND